jgi:uncharacterized protein (DUF433 family)
MHKFNEIISAETGKLSGQACIRGLRITVSDILAWLASGMTIAEILADFNELKEEDIYAALNYASQREGKTLSMAV